MTQDEVKSIMKNNNEKLIDLLFEYFEKEKELAFLRGWHEGQEGSCEKKESKLQESKLFEA